MGEVGNKSPVILQEVKPYVVNVFTNADMHRLIVLCDEPGQFIPARTRYNRLTSLQDIVEEAVISFMTMGSVWC